MNFGYSKLRNINLEAIQQHLRCQLGFSWSQWAILFDWDSCCSLMRGRSWDEWHQEAIIDAGGQRTSPGQTQCHYTSAGGQGDHYYTHTDTVITLVLSCTQARENSSRAVTKIQTTCLSSFWQISKPNIVWHWVIGNVIWRHCLEG